MHKVGLSKDTTESENVRKYMQCVHLTKVSGTAYIRKSYKTQRERNPPQKKEQKSLYLE